MDTEKTEIENNQPELNIATGESEEPKIDQTFARDEPKILNDDQESLENADTTADPEDTGNVSHFSSSNSAHP